jgi:hypothetical protein
LNIGQILVATLCKLLIQQERNGLYLILQMEKLLTVVQLSAYRYVYQYVSIYVPVLGTRTVLDLASYSSTPGSSTSNPSTNLSAATRLLQRQHGGPELFTNSTLDSSDGSKFPEPRHTCGLLSLYCVPSTQLGTFAVG